MKTLKMKKLLICVCFVDIAKIVSRHDAKVQIFFRVIKHLSAFFSVPESTMA